MRTWKSKFSQFKELDAPINELAKGKLNYKAKYSPNYVHSMYYALNSEMQLIEKYTNAYLDNFKSNKNIGF